MARLTPGSVVTIGDSLLGGGQTRRPVASRVAAILRTRGELPLIPFDRSGAGLRGALEKAPELPALRPELVVVCLGWTDSTDSPAPSWWVPDAEGLVAYCAAIAPTLLVFAPAPERCGARGRRWHDRMRAALSATARVPVLDLSELQVKRYLTSEQSAEVADRIVAALDRRP